MSSTYGEHLKLSIFGQSHGAAIGMTWTASPQGFLWTLTFYRPF